MTNGSNKGHRRWPSIFEAATAYDNGNCGYIKPFTNVVVNSNRLWYGKNSTVSAFLATAYDEDGNRVDSMEGYFLEPEHNPDSAKIEGGDKAIMSGTYNIVPKTVIENRINKTLRENGEKEIHLRYDWYIDSVPGRSGIAIHNGNTGHLLRAQPSHHDIIQEAHKISDTVLEHNGDGHCQNHFIKCFVSD